MKRILQITLISFLASNLFAQELPDFGTPQKMGKQINSASSELMPIFSANRMYFSRIGHNSNKGGATAGMDIWYSDYDTKNETWSNANNEMGPLNTKGHNAIIGVSSDGNTVYLLNKYLSGNNSDEGVSYAIKNGNSWGKPQNLDIPGLEKPGTIGFFMMKNGKELILSYNGENSKGQEDLYYTEKKDGLWNEPKSLGDNLNTSGYEMSPFVTDDGQTLYFSSNGHGGEGDADIFMAKRNGASWASWTDPVNLGTKINSSGFDAYFTQPSDSKYFYFVKYNSTTSDDIYRVGIGEEELIEEEKVDTKLIVSGLIFDEKTKEPLSLDLTIIDESNKEEIAKLKSSKDGNYEIELDKEKLYSFNILVKGYHEHHDKVSTPKIAENTTEMEYNLPMRKLEIGTKINLGHIYFVVNTDSLRSISLPQVDKLEKILIDNPELKISIEGHTSSDGLKHLNQELSEKRAEKIKSLLVEKGIKKKRLKTSGFGSTRPLMKNDTEEHRKENRRVDFVIVK